MLMQMDPRHEIPTYKQLMDPTLAAIADLVGTSKAGASNERIHDWVVGNGYAPAHLVSYATAPGRTPLLAGRLSRARTELRKGGWIQKGNVPGQQNKHYALTDKARRELQKLGILPRGRGRGGSRPPSSGSSSQSLVRSNEWDEMMRNIHELIWEVETRPDGTRIERTRLRIRRRK